MGCLGRFGMLFSWVAPARRRRRRGGNQSLEEEELARRKTLATRPRLRLRLRISSAAAASPRRVPCHAASAVGMRVKVMSRSTDDFTRERSQDLQKVFCNYDPALRTQEKAFEYTRPLNAAKLEKIFAKPFIGAMDGHIDAVLCMVKNPNYLKAICSGSMNGGRQSASSLDTRVL